MQVHSAGGATSTARGNAPRGWCHASQCRGGAEYHSTVRGGGGWSRPSAIQPPSPSMDGLGFGRPWHWIGSALNRPGLGWPCLGKGRALEGSCLEGSCLGRVESHRLGGVCTVDVQCFMMRAPCGVSDGKSKSVRCKIVLHFGTALKVAPFAVQSRDAGSRPTKRRDRPSVVTCRDRPQVATDAHKASKDSQQHVDWCGADGQGR